MGGIEAAFGGIYAFTWPTRSAPAAPTTGGHEAVQAVEELLHGTTADRILGAQGKLESIATVLAAALKNDDELLVSQLVMRLVQLSRNLVDGYFFVHKGQEANTVLGNVIAAHLSETTAPRFGQALASATRSEANAAKSKETEYSPFARGVACALVDMMYGGLTVPRGEEARKMLDIVNAEMQKVGYTRSSCVGLPT